LKFRVSLELPSAKDAARIELLVPRIISDFQFYLREVRVEELKGSAGMYRLREALLHRVSAAVAPARIKDLLFKEMLLQ
jgi:flagellar FliL protein